MITKELTALRLASKHAFARRGPAKLTTYRGYRSLKYPTDLILYAELIEDLKIDCLIETGTRFGGSALFFADYFKNKRKGFVLTVENDEQWDPPSHNRIEHFFGDSVSEPIVRAITEKAKGKNTLVVLDSDHSPEHIYNELVAYAPLVTVGSYIIVEDHAKENGYEGMKKFLRTNPNFEVDKEIEKYGIHCAAGGFLKRIE